MIQNYRTIHKYFAISVFSLFIMSCATPSKNSIHQGTSEKQLSDTVPQIKTDSFTLNNGLTVIVHEDHSDPLVHVDVTYHVGSAREEPGKSGFAHLFEHMMFQGSANVDDDEHIKIISESGGSANGTTNRDRTNYLQTVPSNQLETVLWLEADRMGFFIEGITQEKFENQRSTVKNEKHQNYDNRPYGLVWEYIPKTLYPKGHPYSWLTIGELEDLDRANVQDLKNFFYRWYTPNNATLTIGGAVNLNKAKILIEKYFGSIPSGEDVPKLKPIAAKLDDNRYISYHDNNIRFPALVKVWPTVPSSHPDAAALRCLAEILGRGKNSYLYKNLVANNLAIDTSASNAGNELAGSFSTFVLPYPGQALEQIENIVASSLEKFESEGISEQELIDYKTRYETSFIRSLETVAGKVSKLAYYQTFFGDPQAYKTRFKEHKNLTVDDVMRVYRTYIKNKPSVILSALSSPEEKPAKTDNFVIQKPKKGQSFTKEKTNEAKLVRPINAVEIKDNFDRSIRPSAPAAELNALPPFWRESFNNGLEIIATQSSELPTVTIKFSMPGGLSSDSKNLDKLGLASLTANLMNTTTSFSSETDIAKKLEKIGSRISFNASTYRFTVYISSLTKYLDQTLDVFFEQLFHPAFTENDIETHKKRLLESAKSSIESPSSIANIAFNRIIYSASHILGIPDSHIENTIDNLNRADITNRYNQFFTPNGAELVVVGDLNREQITQKLNRLITWTKKVAPAINLPEAPQAEANTIYFIDKENTAQSEIIIGHMTDLPFDSSGEFYKRNLMNFIFGGNFSSRINLNLREDKGITYGARSRYSGNENPGPLRITSSIKGDSTGLAIREIMQEIKTINTQGVTANEINFMKHAIGQSDALKYESNRNKSNVLNFIQRYDLDKDYDLKRQAVIDKINEEDINQLAKKHLDSKKMIMVVVGDKKTVIPQLEQLPYTIEYLNVDGSPIEQ